MAVHIEDTLTATVTPGLGTLLKVTISSVLTTIGQRVSISGPSFKWGVDKITNLDSTAEEKRPTLLDAGSIKCQGEWLGSDASHQFLMTQVLTNPQPTIACQLILATSTHGTWAFNAFIVGFELSGMTDDGHVLFDVEFEITGLPTFS